MTNVQISVLCLIATIVIYFANKRLYRRFRALPLMPLVFTPILLVLMLVFGHISWQNYIGESHWLLWLLGPATIAFAVPVYDNLAIIKRHWMSLSAGVSPPRWWRCVARSGWRGCLRCPMKFSAAWPCVR
jgi:putative effector of murein hydrolase